MFQKKVIEKYLSKLDSDLLLKKYIQYCSIFANKQKQENIRNSKEEQYQEGFIRDLFCSVLGYTIKPEANYNILTELKNESKSNSKKSDAAIIINNEVKAVIELKGTDTQDLDKVAFQAFSYKNHHEKCNYVIVSNFERLRLYVETQIEFTEFNLFKLTKEDFDLLYLLLSLDNISSDVPLKLKHETLTEEIEITNSFYADYSTFKRVLFEDLIENNPDIDKLLLFKKTQKLLDRLLFVMFCEDRNLLPTNSTLGIINDFKKLEDLGYYQPLYNFFKTFFERIDKGFTHKTDHTRDVFAYNGGLFKSDETLDNIKVGDKVLLEHCPKLANYDFASQISVDILGRIFENSLTEIEEVQNEIENEKNGIKQKSSNIGKRKKDGVFYTPEYITKYIVENTIGKLCEEKKNELKINDTEFTFDKKYQKKKINELDERLNKYREWLLSLKILDCACGSGAFLNAALRELKKEHTLIDYFWSKIHKGELNFTQIDNTILENNLYGVDINDDSIEITKLSLWLHTATKNRKLTTLNDKIKCGNSLIDDASVAGEKAFNWEREFPEVFKRCDASLDRSRATPSGEWSVVGDGCDCPKASGEDALKLSLEGENKREGDRIRSKASSMEQASSQADSKNTPLISHLSSLTSQLKGGFDVVIGNPPYVNINIMPQYHEYFRKKYSAIHTGYNDLMYYFLYQGINLLNDTGVFGVITSNYFIGNDYAKKLRLFLNKKTDTIINFHNALIFKEANVHTTLLFASSKPSKNNISVYTFEGREDSDITNIDLIKDFNYSELDRNSENWIIANDKSSNIISKLYSNSIKLGAITQIEQGSKSGKNGIFTVTKEFFEKNKFEKSLIRNNVKNGDIQRYIFFDRGNVLIYTDNNTKIEDYPNTYNYLLTHKEELFNRNEAQKGLYEWFRLDRPRNKAIFDAKEKLIVPYRAEHNRFAYDNQQFFNDGGDIRAIVLKENSEYSIKYLLALLNSSLLDWFFGFIGKTKGTLREYFNNPLSEIPIHIANLEAQQPFIDLADKMLTLNGDLQKKTTRFISRIKETYAFEKTTQNLENFYKLTFTDFVKELSKVKVKITMKQKDELEDYFNDYVKDISELNASIEATDNEINNLVYKIYNLTSEEIMIIEGK